MGGLIGGIAGAVLGGAASKKQQTTTQVQKADPWAPVQPYLQGLYRDAWASGTPQYYPGSTVANLSGNTWDAMNGTRRLAMTPNATMGGANTVAQRTMRGDYLNSNPASGWLNFIGSGGMLGSNPAMENLRRTAGGDFLNSNPYLDSMFGQAADKAGSAFQKYTMPGVNSTFALGGRYGSNAHQTAMDTAQENFGDTLKGLATDIYGGNYARERGLMEGATGTMGSLHQGERSLQNQALGTSGQLFGNERQLMTQMAGMSPELQAAGYLPMEMLAKAGATQDAFNQRKLSDDVSRWDFNQNAERQRLDWINKILMGASDYGTKSTSGSQGVNPIMGMMGGAMMGSQLGGLFGGGSVFPMGSGY